MQIAMTALGGWDNFYVIVGSSAGALIGLQFVVLTLIAEMPSAQGDAQATNAFATPSVVHFGIVLLLSALISVPWTAVTPLAALWGLVGLCGVVYTGIVVRRMRAQGAYRPVLEDWVFHAALPWAAYAALAVAAYLAPARPRAAMFVVGAATLSLLFVGIHNAWDTITHLVFVRKREAQGRE